MFHNSMKKILFSATTLVAVISLVLAGCGDDNDSEGASSTEKPLIVVTTNILGDVVTNMVGDSFDVETIMPPGSDPHDFQASAQQVQTMMSADLLIVNGANFEEGMLDVIENAESDGVMIFEAISVVSQLEGSDDHGHDDHDDHEGHAHGEHDPHAWLSPQIAKIWLNNIAAKLSEIDPDNAASYFSNAKSARDNIDTLITEVNSILDPIRDKKFVVFHDAYQYFEKSFNISASGAISLGDASDPSPARLSEIRKRVVDEAVECVLAEPQYDPGLVKSVLEGTNAKTTVIDPLGVSLETGPNLYENLIRNLATNLAKCF